MESMNLLDVLKYIIVPCISTGGAFAVVAAVFKLHWKVAEAARDSSEALRRTEGLGPMRESIARIAENVDELLGDHRRRNSRSVGL